MKKLTRIKLINWHFFDNETIEIAGSCLISGKNTSGKSTILDALSLVLTVNTKKFNIAANEKGKRNLTGYVRGKTGDDDAVFTRKGAVISYVALEFYEEKGGKYFTLGAYIESPDEYKTPTVKWFILETSLDDISFMTGHRPSVHSELRCKHKKVSFILRPSEAKDRFGRRLGKLDDRFFTMIQKSLAFKPMDKVKAFINSFILDEKNVEVSRLKNNINRLKELEVVMETTKQRIRELDFILKEYENYLNKENALEVSKIFILYAGVSDIEEKLKYYNKNLEEKRISYELKTNEKVDSDKKLERAEKNVRDLELSIMSNDSYIHQRELEKRVDELRDKIRDLTRLNTRYKREIDKLIEAIREIKKVENFSISVEDVKADLLGTEEKKAAIFADIKLQLEEKAGHYDERYYALKSSISKVEETKLQVEKEIQELKDKKLIYPKNTIKLKTIIEREFDKRGITSDVRIFSDLLEISDASWQNAIEGYLSNQRFYLIVEPRYYDVALHAYNAHRNEVEKVGLVNTGKLKIGTRAHVDTLAYLVSSSSDYAASYANFLLGRVYKADSVDELKNHKISITKECMLYKNFAVRKIPSDVYKTPYIGVDAYKKQLELKELEYNELQSKLERLREELVAVSGVKEKLKDVSFSYIEDNLSISNRLINLENELSDVKAELKKVKNDPTIMELQLKLEEYKKVKLSVKVENDEIGRSIINLERDIKDIEESIIQKQLILKEKKEELEAKVEGKNDIKKAALKKYDAIRQKRTYAEMVKNYEPQRAKEEKAKEEAANKLMSFQAAFVSKHQLGYPTGTSREDINHYREEHYKLEKSEIVKYEQKLKKAMENCETELKESFLAKLKENIESAKNSFKQLNKALDGVYYGDDSYRFKIAENKNKANLYKMIMSDKNIEGINLFSSTFEEEYDEEMRDLFDKLLANEDGDKVLKEYTDYRSYLDYDIEIIKKNGKVQKFSKTYGDKSGGETQTPYYVAIAASFAGLYRLDDSIRIILMDEAFNQMDEDRISAMMDFFLSQDFQIILATPPEKMEVIGQKVDTVLLPIRKGTHAVVETYDFL